MIAVLGADSPIGLTVIRELGERGLSVLAQGKTGHALGRYSRHVKHFLATSAPIAAWLPQLVAEHGVTAVLAYSEHHLLQLAALKDDLGACPVLAPDADKLALVLDKQQTFDAAARVGISVPASWSPSLGEDFAARAAALAYPVAIKWPDPNGVVAALAAQGIDLEKVEYAKSAAELLAILARYDKVGLWPLVQTWCPGQGLGQMLHMHAGRATLRFQHRRLREWPPSGGVSSFCESVPLDRHAAQMALSEALLREIGWQGPAMVEYRHDPATGTYWLMEINGRFWGSIPLAYHAGAHFAWETYRCRMLGERDVTAPRLKSRRARYVIPDSKHIVAILRDSSLPLGRRLRAAVAFVTDFADPRVRYYVWSWRDPKPFFGDMMGIVRRALRRGS
ncbi:carboxylate--amine ligase [Novosphingobium sp. JCM 18896]|uniref:carboxylate--amine ligase n=1 Tax=Novosphingobium sp. JCM 18896 TaxID=2989731 RepID=UPI002223C31E|nr:carboxylate--amine ligase [Novosphingobium sp. JCM 18896]MCW1429426.1 carboxylate--amine ligase [Novosphingobium sp. JCM 18896]